MHCLNKKEAEMQSHQLTTFQWWTHRSTLTRERFSLTNLVVNSNILHTRIIIREVCHFRIIENQLNTLKSLWVQGKTIKPTFQVRKIPHQDKVVAGYKSWSRSSLFQYNYRQCHIWRVIHWTTVKIKNFLINRMNKLWVQMKQLKITSYLSNPQGDRQKWKLSLIQRTVIKLVIISSQNQLRETKILKVASNKDMAQVFLCHKQIMHQWIQETWKAKTKQELLF